MASNGFVRVEECACGAVHLTIGAVTLRLEGSALEPIVTVLAQAAGARGIEARLVARRDELLS